MLNGDFSDHSESSGGKVYIFPNAAIKIATILFWVINIVLSLLAFRRNLSLIPLLGLTTCLYLLTGMSGSNWMWFFVWFAIGLIVYFIYGYRKSHLRHSQN